MEGDISIELNPTPRASTSHPPQRQEQHVESTSPKPSNPPHKLPGSASWVPYHKLFSFGDPTDWVLIWVGIVGAVGNGLCMPLMIIMFGKVVNTFGDAHSNTQQLVHQVSQVSLKFVYLALGSTIVAFLQVYCWSATGQRQAARITKLYLTTILRQEISFFDKEISNGEMIERMSGDAFLIQEAMGEKVGKFLQLMVTFIAGFIISFVIGWELTLVMLSSVPLLVVSGSLMAFVITRLASREQASYALATTVVEQTISSIKTVASFTGEKLAMTEYDKCLNQAYKAGVQESLVVGLGLGLVLFIVFSSYALAVWFGAKMITDHGYKGGDIITVVFIVLTGSMSLGQTTTCIRAFAAGQAAVVKLFKVIERRPEIDAHGTKGQILGDIRGDIELRDVHFSYPSRANEPVLSGIFLSIPSGSTAALVGESGSGKSTVISLIERFYDPQVGEVLIDGTNLKELQLMWLRQKIGLVSQEPVLFNCSIKDNIAYGKDGVTMEEIRAAVELACAAKFIDNLPQGLDTVAGEYGTRLSGGQKQLVAIARAMLKDPRILLLDEATSALDTESEKSVQEALERVMKNRTTIIVAHRLSTVRNANMIAVFQQGKIVEKGSHQELVKDPIGAYSQLIKLQDMSTVSWSSKVVTDSEWVEIIVDSGRKSSQRFSLLRSPSRNSSLIGNSSRHSFSMPFSVPTAFSSEEPYDLEPSEIETAPKIPLRRLAYLNKPEFSVLLVGTLTAAAEGLILPIFGLLISNMIKTFFEPAQELRHDSRYWALMFLGLGSICLLVTPLRSYLFGVAGCKLIQRIRSLCFEKIIHMEVGWFDEAEHTSSAIGAKLSGDVTSIRSLVGDSLSLLVQNTATVVAGLGIAFTANWQLAIIILVLLPLIGVNRYIEVKFMKGFGADKKKMYEEASQVANEAVRNIRTVASFCAEDKVMEAYKRKCRGPMKAGMKEAVISAAGFGASSFFLFTIYAASFYAGARLVEVGDTTFAEVFRVFFVVIMTAVGVAQSSSLAPDASKARKGAASVFAILDRKSKIDLREDKSKTTIENVKGEIELRHVSFRYPSRPDVHIFTDLCLSIPSGKTVALVGESGCGKSTMLSLLQRFYMPDSGQITLDGVEISKLQLKWLRQQMGLVSQEPVLFDDTIRANIAYGKEGNATEAEIRAASELANSHKFICSLQQGYETNVGQRGVQLSGGQKQRVAIARAVVKDPKILLLDEATSALDVESEQAVQDALHRVSESRTTVVVAHRLSTIRNAHLIAVIKNGVIAEKGNHASLISLKDGIYASLVALHSPLLASSSYH